jgi:hypothetical protein
MGKGVDIEKLFRQATLENPKYQFYKFPYSQDDDVMLIKKKNRKSWWDDVELTNDIYKMLDIAWDCGHSYNKKKTKPPYLIKWGGLIIQLNY